MRLPPGLPTIAPSAGENFFFAKRPWPFAFMAAPRFLPAAEAALDLCWPFRRLPPGKRTFFFLAFLRFFFAFFFFAFFFFFFGFFAAFFFLAGFFFFFAASCCVRAMVDFWISFWTLPVSMTTIASSGSMSTWGKLTNDIAVPL